MPAVLLSETNCRTHKPSHEQNEETVSKIVRARRRIVNAEMSGSKNAKRAHHDNTPRADHTT